MVQIARHRCVGRAAAAAAAGAIQTAGRLVELVAEHLRVTGDGVVTLLIGNGLGRWKSTLGRYTHKMRLSDPLTCSI